MLNLTMLLVPIEAAEVALPEESSGEVFCCGDFFLFFGLRLQPHASAILRLTGVGVESFENIELYHVRFCVTYYWGHRVTSYCVGSLLLVAHFPCLIRSRILKPLEETRSWGQSITRCFRKCGLGEQQLTTLVCLAESMQMWHLSKDSISPHGSVFVFIGHPPLAALYAIRLESCMTKKFRNSFLNRR